MNWAQYCQDLYYGHNDENISHVPIENESLDSPIEFSEFLVAVTSLKRNKAPGKDRITNEDVKLLLPQDSVDFEFGTFSEMALNMLFNLIEVFWKFEKIPVDLKRVILRPFLKNIDKDEHDPKNYRTISLLNTFFKLYEAIIHRRLIRKLENEFLLSSVQAAYRPRKSTSDHIFVLQELFLEYRFNKVGKRGGRNKKPLYLCFTDLEKAFDKVWRNRMFTKLYNIGVTGKMLRVTRPGGLVV